jgi:hypothetical protein
VDRLDRADVRCGPAGLSQDDWAVLEDRSSVIEGRVSQEPKSAPFDQQRRAADEGQSQLIVGHAEPSQAAAVNAAL